MPPEAAGAKGLSYIKTIEQEKDVLRDLFDKYNSAKLKVDGQIIPNLVLNSAIDLQPTYKRFGFEIDKKRRILTFMTTSNLLYQVDFDRYYLKANESVFVRSVELNELSGYIRAFDMVLDHSYNQYVYVVGTSKGINAKDIDNQKSLQEIQDQTLTFIRYEQGSQEPIYQQVKQDESSYFGFAKLIKKGFESIINRANNQIIGGSSKRVQPDMRQSSINMAYEEGIVALKSLSNGLIAAVYTSGILKVWSVVSGICLLQHEFFDVVNNDQGFKIKQNQRIVEAKIQSISYPFITDTQAKTIKLAVSYASSSIKDQERQWTVDQLNLNFTNLPTYQIDRVNEDSFDISQQKHELIPHIRMQLENGSEIQDMVIEYNKKSSHIWLLVQKEDGDSTIMDLLEPNEQIFTRENQESYYQLLDKVNLSYDLQTNPNSPYKKQLQKHYYKRLTIKGRFSNMTIKQQLSQLKFNEGDFQKYTFDQMFERLCLDLEVSSLQQVLSSMIKTESINQKAYGISSQFDDLPFRLVLRPVGISLLKIDSYFTSLTSRANTLTSQLANALKSQQLLDYYEEESTLLFQRNQQQQNLQQQQKNQQFYEIITSNDDNPLLLLLSSIQLLHIDVLPSLDKILRKESSRKQTASDDNIKDLIIKAMRESYNYEILNNEILRIVNSQRQQIENQVNNVIECIVGNLLQNNANDGKELDVQQQINGDDNQYSINVIRVIERGTIQEVQSLYQLLRDLLMVKTYINLNKPFLGQQVQHIQYDQLLQESLIFWLKQLSSLTWLMTQNIDIRAIQQSKKLPLIMKLLSQQSPQSLIRRDVLMRQQQPQLTFVPLSLYFLTYLPQTYQHSPLTQSFNQHFDLSLFSTQSNDVLGVRQQRIGQVEPRSSMFSNILVNFIKKYMFKQNMQEQTFIPHVIRKLYSLKMFNLIDKYLRPLDDLNTIGLDFLKAIIAASHLNQPAEFLEHMCSCLALYHHCINMGVKPQSINLVFQKKQRLQVSQKINLVSDNEITRFYLILLSQLDKLDERYSLFVINSALMEEGIPSIVSMQNQLLNRLSEKDYFYNKMFEIASIQNSPDSLYTACTQIESPERKKELIGEFLHRILQSPDSQHLLFSQYFFTQDQIDMGLDYLCNKVLDQLAQIKRRIVSQTQLETKKIVTRLIRDIHIVSQLYDRQDEIARFLWYFAHQIEDKISEQYQGEITSESFKDILEMKEFVLVILYQNSVYLGEHLFITDSSEIENLHKKRKSEQMSGQKQQSVNQNQALSSDTFIMQEGYGVLNYLSQQYHQLRFKKGEIKLVKLEHIIQELYLTQGRLSVAEFFNEKDPNQLMYILTELKEYSLAINIALAYNLQVAYPLTYLIQSIKSLEDSDNANDWKDSDYHINDLIIVTPQNKNERGEQQYQLEVSSQRFTLKIKQLISLAQGLISIHFELPLTLEQAIVDQGHIKELIQMYLVEENGYFKYHEAFSLLRRYLPRSVQDLVVSDFKLLAKFLQDSEEFIQINQREYDDFKQEIQSQQQVLEFKRNKLRQSNINTNQIRDSVLNDIDEFLGRDKIQNEKADIIGNQDDTYNQMQSNILQMNKVSQALENAQMGIAEITNTLQKVLNK